MKLWPDIPNSWEVLQIGATERRIWNITDGTKAITTARQWHNDVPGEVYVFTPRRDVYLTMDNGFSRRGF